jgi:(p)ppGpp synthase/HD superfamily hydrolase
MSETMEPKYGERYETALAYAARLHRTQSRKGTEIPYISHLLAVSALVWEYGGDEVTAIAALLHDAIEDQGRGGATAHEIGEEFGYRVLRIVQDCSDTDTIPKPPWVERKRAYIKGLRSHDNDTLLVVLADKFHNCQAMVADIEDAVSQGTTVEEFFERFNSTPEGTLWYYHRIHKKLAKRKIGGALLGRFNAKIDEFATLVGVDREAAQAVPE